MAEIVGIRFKKAGRVYYFDPAGIDLEVNDYVVVETSRGLELGHVVIAPKQVLVSEISTPLKPVVRKAEPEDISHAQELEDREEEALIECGKLIAKLNLPMKLLSAEYNLDSSRLTFFFSAAERVDFRELVRELTSQFKARLELRQVGPRDEAKLIGGFGRCGRPLCCMSFLSEFAPVSIRMAKEQDLPLNPMKIPGVCGRLLCCLGYENEQYHALKGNPLKETVLVELESQATVELPLTEVTIEGELLDKRRRKPGKRG
jgi:cell fate regulator YaaT (PSP1 superfamily)